MGRVTLELASEALRLADSQPRRAAQLATRAVAAARTEGDREAESVSGRASGLAAFYLKDVDSAVRHLRAAIVAGQRANSPQRVGEARMTLAYVENWRGRTAMAVRFINVAVAETTGIEHARAVAQRGAIKHQLGRVAAAMEDYRAALPSLRRGQDLLWVQRVLSNRGIAHTERREFSAARADLQEARRICEELGLELLSGVADQNLGTVEAFDGRLPEALEHYGAAENRFRELGSLVGSVLVDRSEVLLSARLIPEARDAAELAIADFQSERRFLMIPDVRLLLARIAQSDGDAPVARHQAILAAREFDRAGRSEWAALARLSVVALGADGAHKSPRTNEVLSLVEATHRLRPDVVIEALLMQGQRELSRGHPDVAASLLSRASAYRRRGAATLRARGWYAEAVLRQARGEKRATLSAARAGLNTLDQFGAALGASDLRANIAGHRVDLAQLGLRYALSERSASNVLAWAERGKASHLLQSPVHPPDDPRLASDLAQLRAIVHQIEEATEVGAGADALMQERVDIERRVRDLSWRHRADRTRDRVTFCPTEIAADLREAALVEYTQADGDLHVVTLVDGHHRLRPLGRLADIETLAARVPFALHRLQRASLTQASATAARTLLEVTCDELDATLMHPLTELGDRSLVVVPTGALQWLPWAVLPSCRGRPVTVVPTASLWQSAIQRCATTEHVLVAAGPALPGAREEAQAVAAIHGVPPLVDDQATVAAVSRQLAGTSIAHLAAHGRVRADNPQFGSLRLADGPLMIYDLERLASAPHTLVVAACDAGRPVSSIGDELLGLTATLLGQGSAQLIASVSPILDVESGPMMSVLHTAMAAGRSAATALAAAQEQSMGRGRREFASAAGFVCFGAGFLSAVSQ